MTGHPLIVTTQLRDEIAGLAKRLGVTPRTIIHAATQHYAERVLTEGQPPQPLYSVVPRNVVESVHRVFAHGVGRPGRSPLDWRNGGQSVRSIIKGADHHLDAIERGYYRDTDSGEPHRAHVISRHMMALDLEMSGWQ